MESIIQKLVISPGIAFTAYNRRRNKDPTVLRTSAMILKAKIQSKDSRIAFSHCNFFMENDERASTDFVVYPTGSAVA